MHARARVTDLVEQVLNQLNLVRHFGATEDGEERPLGRLEHFGKVLELFRHEQTGSLLRQVDSDHGRVGAVSGAERVVDVDVAELGQTRTEFLDCLGVGLRLFTLRVFR